MKYTIIIGTGQPVAIELAPLEDRSLVHCIITTPEGTAYEYMDKYMDRLVQLVRFSTRKAGMLGITRTGFRGTGAVNSGFHCGWRWQSRNERTQHRRKHRGEADRTLWAGGRAFVVQDRPSVWVAARAATVCSTVLQNNSFDKLKSSCRRSSWRKPQDRQLPDGGQ